MAGKRTRKPPAPPPAAIPREPFQTATPFERRMACEIAFADAAGSTLVGGEPPSYVLAGLAARAAGVTFSGPPKQTRATRRALTDAAPAWAATAAADAEGLPVVDEAHASLVLCGLEAPSAEDACERLLGATADGGALVLDVPRPPPAVERRLVRLFAAAAEGSAATRPAWAPADRLTLFAKRRAPFGPDLSDEPAGALPVAVVIVVRDAAQAEEPLADLLLRQTLPPREVFVLDLSPAGARPVPHDLFGFHPSPLTRAALLPKPGADFAAAVDDALSGVESPFVAIVDADVARFAPNHFSVLGMALERDPAASAAFPDVADVSAAGVFTAVRATTGERLKRPVRSVVDEGAFRLSAGLWRTDFVHELGAFDPVAGATASLDFRLRAAARGRFVAAPFPTIALRPEADDPDPRARAELAATIARFVERFSIAEAAREFDERPEDERVPAAIAHQGEALLAVGLGALAALRFEAALKRRPADRDARSGRVRALIATGRFDEAAAAAEASDDPERRDLLLGLTFAARGDAVRARARFAAVLTRDPGCTAARFNLVAVRFLGDAAASEELHAAFAAEGRDGGDRSRPLLGDRPPTPGVARPPRSDERCA